MHGVLCRTFRMESSRTSEKLQAQYHDYLLLKFGHAFSSNHKEWKVRIKYCFRKSIIHAAIGPGNKISLCIWCSCCYLFSCTLSFSKTVWTFLWNCILVELYNNLALGLYNVHIHFVAIVSYTVFDYNYDLILLFYHYEKRTKYLDEALKKCARIGRDVSEETKDYGKGNILDVQELGSHFA